MFIARLLQRDQFRWGGNGQTFRPATFRTGEHFEIFRRFFQIRRQVITENEVRITNQKFGNYSLQQNKLLHFEPYDTR